MFPSFLTGRTRTWRCGRDGHVPADRLGVHQRVEVDDLVGRHGGLAGGVGYAFSPHSTSIHSPSLTRGCQPTALRCERIRTNTRMSAPTTSTTAFAITNRWSATQPSMLVKTRPIDVLTIWSAPQAADSVSLRVFTCSMFVIANQQVTTRPSQMLASIHLGTERRTGGNTMAAAIPA